MARGNSRYKSTVQVQTSSRDYQNSSVVRRRRVDIPPASHSSNGSINLVSYHRSQAAAPITQGTSSRSDYSNFGPSGSLRTTSSSSSLASATTRRTSNTEVPSTSSFSSAITVQNRSTIPNSSSINQSEDLTRNVSVLGKRYSTDSTRIANHFVIVPQAKSTQITEKQHSHLSCPIAFQNQINLGTITVLSDSSSDNTILHHLPDHNETTDKSQQSLHDERLHRSPRKPNHQLVNTRLRSTSSIDDQKKLSIPSIHYTIEPIQVFDDVHDENHLDAKQRAIRDEKKRKANENEQVLINVDEYRREILEYLKQREVRFFQC